MRAFVPFSLLLLAPTAFAQGAGWPYSMDFGPYLMTTLEAGGRAGDTVKAVVVRLGDPKAATGGGAVAFDTELLRLSAAWTHGWLRLRGTAYDGAHGPMVHLRGRKVAESAVGPGWAKDGDLTDPRSIQDGPLPRDWGQYRGLWLNGDRVIVHYRVGDMDVREGYGLEQDGRVVTRTLELGPSQAAQLMLVESGPDGAAAGQLEMNAPQRFAMLQWSPQADGPVELDATTLGWSDLAMGGPSAHDYLDAASGTGATIAAVTGFAPVASKGGGVAVLHDGAGSENDDDLAHNSWFERHEVDGRRTDNGRLHVDLRRTVDVSRISTFSWHRADRSIQRYDVYGTADEKPDLAAGDLAAAGWQKLASVNTEALGEGDKHAVSVHRDDGLGSFRHLLFDVHRGGEFLAEIDVFADKFRADVDAVGRGSENLFVALRGDPRAEIGVEGNRILLRVPPHDAMMRVELAMAAGDDRAIGELAAPLVAEVEVARLPTKAAPKRWGEPIVTQGNIGEAADGFAVDTITIPFENRFGSRMRTGGFDFFSDGRAAVSTWNGDVWIVEGIDDDLDELRWSRFATGLFDPLGLRIVNDLIFVHGRDGITMLLDTDGNGEADYYECFNNMVCATDAFHEFAFDLQTDKDGNFYFSKAGPVNPGGRGFMRIAPHHGTFMKVSKDGSKLEVIATGLRAPNGIGVHEGPHGTFFTSGDNEGTFMPRCRINWFWEPGYYGGVKDCAHRTPVPDEPDLPLCWMPMEIDNSSGGQVMVPSAGPWQDLAGRILHCSYGTCSVYLVQTEWPGAHDAGEARPIVQGGVVRLPVDFSSSCMRPRFSPIDGQLYVVGLKGWQTSAAREGGFHRVRRVAGPLTVPTGLKTCKQGVYLTFTEELDPEVAEDPSSYAVEIWNYLYSPSYGSPELSVLHPDREVEHGQQNRDPLTVTAAKLGPDKRTVFLAIDGMQPVHQMKITWNVDTAAGEQRKGELHNTIHMLREDPGF
ncbi:MAG: hypothetical protein KDE27_25825 [Planctomycetes bacterium]|nr:hypothetical protein [Planctomycetota bacterium]